MEARISKIRDFTIIEFAGPLDFETPEKLMDELEKALLNTPKTKCILNMEKLDFVGSSGIERFMSQIEKLFGRNARCIGLKKEFKRCFQVFSQNNNTFKYYSDINEALNIFDNVGSGNADNQTINC